MDWSREEVEAIVADELHMLTLELAGQNYSKTEHRGLLQPKLIHRSESSIGFKRANISAAVLVDQFERWRLVELGQHRLADKVEHTSQSKCDGLGYDSLFDLAGVLDQHCILDPITYRASFG